MNLRNATVWIWILCLLALGACARPDVSEPRTRLPGIDAPKQKTGPPDEDDDEEARAPAGSERPSGVLEALWVKLDHDIRNEVPEGTTVGCLPYVSYDRDHEQGWVSQLGVRIADELAERLQRGRMQAFGASGMELLIRDTNGTKATLSEGSRVLEDGDRLGVDVIVYGRINLRNLARFQGAGAPRILEVKGTAVNIVTARVISEHTVEISNQRRDNARYWQWARSPSDWLSDGRWGPPEPEPTLDRELAVASKVLARRILPQISGKEIEGAVYIPPTDTATFVRSIASLRAAQASFARAFDRRRPAAGEESPEDTAPLMLNGVEFPDLQAAEAYVTALRESLWLESEGGRFARDLASQLGQALLALPARNGTEFRINDAGFTEDPVRIHEVESQLATGGLALDLEARQALRGQGIEIVAAPRLERYASHFVLRVDLYDLEKGSLIGGSHFRIEDRFAGELRLALGIRDYPLEKIGDLGQTIDSSWSDIFERVKSGVVRVQGSQGYGSGFVVSNQGHIVTNSHVVNGIGNEPSVLMQDGRRRSYRTVLDDARWDIAVLQVADLPADTYIFEFADAGRARVGTEVAVLGHPKNTQGWVFTKGNISSIREQVKSGGSLRASYMYTSPTRGGSSGSPVLLLDGAVVAVHSAGQVGFLDGGVRGTELVGFALGVPGHEAEKLLNAAIR